jgi:hypothetical protein
MIIMCGLEGNNPDYVKSRKTQYAKTGFKKKREVLSLECGNKMPNRCNR